MLKNPLGGKNGYINGVDALNKACKALYSTAKGEARNLNFEDVVKVLKYNGPLGQYTDETKTVIKYNTAPTVKDVIGNSTTRLGTAALRMTPDGTDIMKYKVNHLFFTLADDIEYIKGDAASKGIIFIPEDINYWIADTGLHLSFGGGNNFGEFGVRRGNDRNISGYTMFRSNGTPAYKADIALRPVVELTGSLTYSYDANTNTITLN